MEQILYQNQLMAPKIMKLSKFLENSTKLKMQKKH